MIPARAHFVWFGSRLPYAYALAVVSAARAGELDEVVLHHADDLSDCPNVAALRALRGFASRRIDPRALFDGCADVAPGLADVYARLSEPAGRANVVRAALLFGEGGVYLDTDTITVRSLRPLLAHGAFYGVEHVVRPQRDEHRTSRWHLRRRWLLTKLRERLAARPHGYRAFRRLRALYPTAANNAVLGAEPGSPVLAALLRGMAETPEPRQTQRYALGTHLLQQVVEGPDGAHATALPPDTFFPLPPGICNHWFRQYDDAAACLSEVLRPTTCVVHWYASNETRAIVDVLDADWVRAHAATSMFGALALPFVD